MRSILTLSLPPDVLASLKRKAKHAGTSVSAYVRRLVVHEEHLISEEELLQKSKKALREYRKGNYKVLKSFEDFA